jgi:lysozyme family protein
MAIYPATFEAWYKDFIDADTEGGISNRSKEADPAGLTYRGLRFDNFQKFAADINVEPTKENFLKLNDAQLKAIFYKRYWKAYRIDNVKPRYQIAAMDACFNGGGIRSLAPVIGKNSDGTNKRLFSTPEGLNSSGLSVPDLMKNRLEYLKTLRNYEANKNGWQRRLNDIVAVTNKFLKGNTANTVIILLLFVLLASIYY